MQLTDTGLEEKSNPIGVLLFISAYLEEQGFDPQLVFDQFKINQNDFKNKLMPVSLQMQANIFKVVGELTNCDHLGLIIGQKACLSNIGPLRFLVLNAATMRDAIGTLFHYGHMWYRGQKIELKEEELDYASISTTIDCEESGIEQYQTAQLVAIVSIIELILGKLWRPTLVRISYPKPKSAHLYEKFFRCPVWFGQAQHEIIFPQAHLDQQREHDDQLAHFFHHYLSELQDNDQTNIILKVSKLIEELLPYRVCTSDRIAEYFSIHRYTLYRYLSKYNTTFSILLEDVRKKVVIKLLKNKKLLLIEIANQLGYDDQANFTRAFKKWYGITPGRWRREKFSNH